MWECPKCGIFQQNPKANDDHTKACKAVNKSEPLLGWQGLKLDGIPRDKNGVLFSDKYEGWKKLAKPQF